MTKNKETIKSGNQKNYGTSRRRFIAEMPGV